MKIKRWYKSLSLNDHIPVFYELFKNVNGYTASKKARINCDALEYVYGEIDFISFLALLSLTKPDANTVFYDLGSGVGKAVFACGMVFKVKKCCGIEIFSELHENAIRQHEILKKLEKYKDKSLCISFINSDFLKANFTDATIIFLGATAFFGEYWQKVINHLEQVKPGTLIITTSKALSSNAFIVINTTTVQMSWGLVTAYIQRRIVT